MSVRYLNGLVRCVSFSDKMWVVWQGLDAQRQGSVHEAMRMFTNGFDLPPERFKFERRVDGEAVFAFKGWQLRLYGGYVPNVRPAEFLIVEVDTAKKQNRADQACLVRAGKALKKLPR